VAVVTGGSRGIGREIAVELACSGAQTVIVSSSADNLASAAKAIATAGFAPLTITADLRTLEGCQQAFDTVSDKFNPLPLRVRCQGQVALRPDLN
jgi:3-oxoacyl-[acyl-carrier protein] reductase